MNKIEEKGKKSLLLLTRLNVKTTPALSTNGFYNKTYELLICLIYCQQMKNRKALQDKQTQNCLVEATLIHLLMVES